MKRTAAAAVEAKKPAAQRVRGPGARVLSPSSLCLWGPRLLPEGCPASCSILLALEARSSGMDKLISAVIN